MEPQAPINSIETTPKKSVWHTPINFVHAALVITIIGAGLTLYATHKSEQISASHDVVVSKAVASPWEGKWIREDSRTFEESAIMIQDSTPRSFKFDVVAESGGASGEWANYSTESIDGSGTLTVEGSTASYIDTLRDDGYSAKPCTATFVLSSDGATLTLQTNCDQGDDSQGIGGYAGVGVTFGGTYRKDVVVKEASMQNAQLFAGNPDGYAAFSSLVGPTKNAFDSTMDLENGPEHDDALDAMYSSFAVRHMYGTSESMILVSGTKIWAAVFDWDDTAKEDVTRYYTNVAGWEKKVPTTITDWNRGRKIIYMSAK